MAADGVERWWMNAAFLAADRLLLAGATLRLTVASIGEALDVYDFSELSGPASFEKSFALKRLLEVLREGWRSREVRNLPQSDENRYSQ